MKQPLVSIVITCYNYADYVAESIESALAQSYSNVEVIVIDDGSTDNSLEIIKQYSKKIKIVTRENKGVVFTRNEALGLVNGDFFLQLDADDFLDNDYVESVVRCAIRTKADIVYTDFKKFGAVEETSSFPEYSFEIMKNSNFIHISSLVRTSAVGDVRFDENLSGMTHEDWDFFLSLCVKGAKATKCKESFLHYRIHDSESRNNRQRNSIEHKKYLDVYAYVVRKHLKNGDVEQFGYLTGATFADWYSSLYETSQDMEVKLERKNLEIKQKEREKSDLAREIDILVTSPAYRVGRIVLLPVRACRKIVKKTIGVKRRLSYVRAADNIDRVYRDSLDIDVEKSRAADRFAIIVHLYYVDNWPLFLRKLRLLPDDKFDLYVTMPEQNTHFVETIHQDFPGARTVISPNRGRDVLPFIKVAELINHLGYRSILKFHSKKSTHWSGGQDWLEATLDAIIPDDKESLDKILDIAMNKEYGVLGPKEFYYPLTINYPANSRHLREVLDDLYGKDTAESTLGDRREYGFFGGTMLWMNVSAIEPLLRYNGTAYFEEEAGQVDGTFAHAIERLLTLVPEMDSKDIYETDGVSVVKRSYKSKNIPDWSEDHDK